MMNKMVDGSGVEAATVGAARGWCSPCPLGHWPTHKSELDGSLCAPHCIICPLSSLLENYVQPKYLKFLVILKQTPKMKYLEMFALGEQRSPMALGIWASQITWDLRQ